MINARMLLDRLLAYLRKNPMNISRLSASTGIARATLKRFVIGELVNDLTLLNIQKWLDEKEAV